MLTLGQELIDSTTDGGGAFILFALMVFLFVGILFAVDKVRSRASEERQESED